MGPGHNPACLYWILKGVFALTAGLVTDIMIFNGKLNACPRLLNFEEGKMMKIAEKVGNFAFRLFILGFVLCALVFSFSGCRYPVKAADFLDDVVEDVVFLGTGEEFALPGETEAERRRKWNRIERLNRREMMADIDAFLLLDKPSKLSDRRIR